MPGAWTVKRFWTDVTVEPQDGGFAVLLDGRPIRTPGRRQMILPTRALAQIVAAEWAAQTGEIKPVTMPATRTANSAIETVAQHRAAIVEDLAGYGGTDLICYRAAMPAGLKARQAAGWDPLLHWAGSRFGADLRTVEAISPIAQEEDALRALATEIEGQDDFQLAAFYDLVALSGSLVIALAVIEGIRSPEEAWTLSRIDEDWQIEQWGEDDEAAAVTRDKRAAFVHAARFHALCGKANARSEAGL
jgi:chaperone required for assembly of F1-ATPase